MKKNVRYETALVMLCEFQSIVEATDDASLFPYRDAIRNSTNGGNPVPRAITDKPSTCPWGRLTRQERIVVDKMFHYEEVDGKKYAVRNGCKMETTVWWGGHKTIDAIWDSSIMNMIEEAIGKYEIFNGIWSTYQIDVESRGRDMGVSAATMMTDPYVRYWEVK